MQHLCDARFSHHLLYQLELLRRIRPAVAKRKKRKGTGRWSSEVVKGPERHGLTVNTYLIIVCSSGL